MLCGIWVNCYKSVSRLAVSLLTKSRIGRNPEQTFPKRTKFKQDTQTLATSNQIFHCTCCIMQKHGQSV